MKITEIAYKLNDNSSRYQIGELQNIRKRIKNLKRKAGQTIFREESISKEGWAFHYGGRKEIQFNIGFEDEGFRFGLAFSLEPSQSLPDVSILFPKIYKLNCLIREEPELFTEYKMWNWQKEERSPIEEVREIKPKLVSSQTFIFFGKIVEVSAINYDEILETFDNLLEIYLEVEDENIETKPIENEKLIDFEFSKKERKLILKRDYTSTEKAISIDIRHTMLQQKLIEELTLKYGKENVSYENPLNGKKIDIVVKEEDEYIFFEVKTGSSAKTCIREAIGQLLEYAFWGGREYARKLVIATEYELSDDGNKYLNLLREKYGIPIDYKKIEIK